MRQRVGVVVPVRGIGRAVLAGDVGRRRSVEQHELLLLPGHFLDRERDGGRAAVGDHVDALIVVPVAHDVGGDVRLVLVIGGDDLDRLAEHRTEILRRHARRDAGALAGDVGIERVHVAEHADLHLRGCGVCCDRQQGGKQQQVLRRIRFLPLYVDCCRLLLLGARGGSAAHSIRRREARQGQRRCGLGAAGCHLVEAFSARRHWVFLFRHSRTPRSEAKQSIARASRRWIASCASLLRNDERMRERPHSRGADLRPSFA